MEYKEHTIMITSEEEKTLSYFAESVSDWMQTVITKQCDIALEEIVAITIKKCLEEKVQIPLTKSEMVDLAYSKGWIITAAERNTPAVGISTEQHTE